MISPREIQDVIDGARAHLRDSPDELLGKVVCALAHARTEIVELRSRLHEIATISTERTRE